MADYDFGLYELSNEQALVNRVLRESKKMSFLAGKETLYQAYDITFGVHDYVQQAVHEQAALDPNLARPLSTVAMHAAETYDSRHTRFGQQMLAFMEFGVAAKTGMSYLDFLELPVEYAASMLIIAKESYERENKAQSAAIDHLNQASPNSKK